MNDRSSEGNSGSRIAAFGSLLTDSHLQSCHSARPSRDRRHPASRDPLRSHATGCNAAAQKLVVDAAKIRLHEGLLQTPLRVTDMSGFSRNLTTLGRSFSTQLLAS